MFKQFFWAHIEPVYKGMWCRWMTVDAARMLWACFLNDMYTKVGQNIMLFILTNYITLLCIRFGILDPVLILIIFNIIYNTLVCIFILWNDLVFIKYYTATSQVPIWSKLKFQVITNFEHQNVDELRRYDSQTMILQYTYQLKSVWQKIH